MKHFIKLFLASCGLVLAALPFTTRRSSIPHPHPTIECSFLRCWVPSGLLSRYTCTKIGSSNQKRVNFCIRRRAMEKGAQDRFQREIGTKDGAQPTPTSMI